MAFRMTILRGLALMLALVVAGLFSQLPGFGAVYRTELPATLAVLQERIQRFDAQARAGGLEPVEAIQAMLSSVDLAQRTRGEQIAAMAARVRVLEAQEEAFSGTNPFARLAAVALHFDPPLLSASFAAFTPAWPSGLPALISGMAGFVLTLLAFWFIGRFARPAPGQPASFPRSRF